ncbi:TPA: ESPR domain-containing protein [Escherichia coli]|nr:ESPR domain-containing protein [Escherichia coli]HDI6313510.1 ESPR domain-containing protein [Escherichia coli]
MNKIYKVIWNHTTQKMGCCFRIDEL